MTRDLNFSGQTSISLYDIAATNLALIPVLRDTVTKKDPLEMHTSGETQNPFVPQGIFTLLQSLLHYSLISKLL